MLSNLKLRLIDEAGYDVPGALYGKVVSIGAGGKSEVLIHFTSMSREIETFLGGRRKKAVGGEQSLPASYIDRVTARACGTSIIRPLSAPYCESFGETYPSG